VETSVKQAEMEVGSAFSNSLELKRVVREMAIAGLFEITVVESCQTRHTVKCKVGNCPWRLHAAKAEDAATFILMLLLAIIDVQARIIWETVVQLAL
jgi:MuDR family transposase